MTARCRDRGGAGRQAGVGRPRRVRGDRRPGLPGPRGPGHLPPAPRGATRTAGCCGLSGPVPSVTAADGLIGILGAVVLGSLVAVGVAVGLSPLVPVGPGAPRLPGQRDRLRLDGARHRPGGPARRARSWPRSCCPTGGRLTERPRVAAPTARSSGVARGPKRRGCRWPAWSACVSRSNRGGAAPRCRCARRWWAPSSPSPWWWPPSLSPAACTPWCRTRRSTGGTGTTRSTRPTTSRRRP